MSDPKDPACVFGASAGADIRLIRENSDIYAATKPDGAVEHVDRDGYLVCRCGRSPDALGCRNCR